MVRQTSIEAYEELVVNGKESTQKALVLNTIINNPGQTRREISVRLGLEPGAIAGRVNALLNEGLAQEGRVRMCRFSGKNVNTLEPVKVVESDCQIEMF